jgi:hypothetical protein
MNNLSLNIIQNISKKYKNKSINKRLKSQSFGANFQKRNRFGLTTPKLGPNTKIGNGGTTNI